MSQDIVILGGARTPMAEYSGTPGSGKLKDVSAIDLCVHATKAALERTGIAADQVEHIAVGNALQTSTDAIYGARHVGLKAGLPIETPAVTLNRLCGSGIQSAVTCAQMMQLGEAKLTVAGGMESMSQAPFVARGIRDGIRFGVQPQLEDSLFSSLMDPYCGLYMAQTAENIARQSNISRQAQDDYALRSHQLGAAAVQSGVFADEIAPIEVQKGRKTFVVDTDDHIKPDTTLEALSGLRAAFGKEGTVTAGNASGIVDGAAALVLATADHACELGKEPIAKIRSWGMAGVAPDVMGMGPVPAIKIAVERAGLSLEDIDYFEINEAFSAQYLGVEKDLGLDRDKCNVNGGAIALGHPLGATGTRLLLTLLYQLRRTGKSFGCASACIGGGQGIAMILESL
ncbi:MAG: acetyl-CoA C-acyltransferase [Planctomycetes bacterium]|jgi:acetyl-CoA acetyltransferase family protein|nr:acetyl-CoA C-acyltransferase [Planctomycetota bacterium]MDP6424788.1 acetyl-CoA C-acyltransferase [Planctomycetota bacterium]